jgi:hypothetical protein
MSRKTLPKISIGPKSIDTYIIGNDQIFPRGEHPDTRSRSQWLHDMENKKALISFQKKYGPINDGRRSTYTFLPLNR